MQSETRNCQNCKKDFIIESDDFAFYEKIKVPPPLWCAQCRQQRRYAWRNERTLYKRYCDLCKKSIVSIYHPDSSYVVYCQSCWWGDDWDPALYGADFDESKPFLEQFAELMHKVPRVALLAKNSINSEYTNHSSDNKDCYLCFDTFNAQNVLYASNCWDGLRDSCDCNMIADKGESLYECTSCDRSYNCQFCLLVTDSMDCMYSFDCRNCNNCFLSYNLRNKRYCILNEQYTKEAYEEKIKTFNLGSRKARMELYEKWISMIKNTAIHRFAQIEKSINVSGDVILNSKDCHNVFDCIDSENVKHSTVVIAKDSMDVYSVGLGGCENVYECHAMVGAANVKFTNLSYNNSFVEYCDSVHNSNNLFGCIGLRNAKYCILNKQYSKEDYEKITNTIISSMSAKGEYGGFFPPELSPFGYNETHAQIFMPLDKKTALGMGYKWQDDIPATRGKQTVDQADVSDEINSVSDDFINEILECVDCKRNYTITTRELDFYKAHGVPVPTMCHNCRYQQRVLLRPERKLWHRGCACSKEGHANHTGKCAVEFETSYSPDGSELVYCEKCYQQEVY